jgi:D-alanine-D-alanine ligase
LQGRFYFRRSNKQIIFLEINTVPGQSEASIVPQQVRAKGMTLVDFYGNLIEECIKK